MSSLMRILPRTLRLRYLAINPVNHDERRGMKRWEHWARMELKHRKDGEVLDPAEEHRSTYAEWNWSSELYAFAKRLGENIPRDLLQTALTDQSYIDREEKKRMELRLPKEQISLGLENNDHLAQIGEKLMSDYILRYLRYFCPYYPEEGIRAIHDYFMSENVQAHVAANIGTRELILCAEIYPEKPTYAKALKAVVGAILKESKEHQAELFVQDFVLTQSVSKDISEIWQPFNPMGILRKILERDNRAPPESRLIRESGRNTIIPLWVVGIYSDKQLIGSGPGETLDIAEEMAARDSLKKLFCMKEDRPPFPFGKGRELQLISKTVNLGVDEWTSSKARMRSATRQALQ